MESEAENASGNEASDELSKKRNSSARIQWDEKTIAEHDKERGSRYQNQTSFEVLLIWKRPAFIRQKIDEAPTPYRYMSSESDQSECESGSDAESLISLGENGRDRGTRDQLDSIGTVSPQPSSLSMHLLIQIHARGKLQYIWYHFYGSMYVLISLSFVSLETLT